MVNNYLDISIPIVILAFILALSDFFIRLMPESHPSSSELQQDRFVYSVPSIESASADNIALWLSSFNEVVEPEPIEEAVEVVIDETLQSGDILELVIEQQDYRLIAVVSDNKKSQRLALLSNDKEHTDNNNLSPEHYISLEVGNDFYGYKVIEVGKLNIVMQTPHGNNINLLLFERVNQ